MRYISECGCSKRSVIRITDISASCTIKEQVKVLRNYGNATNMKETFIQIIIVDYNG